jgi:hypothetical protein
MPKPERKHWSNPRTDPLIPLKPRTRTAHHQRVFQRYRSSPGIDRIGHRQQKRRSITIFGGLYLGWITMVHYPTVLVPTEAGTRSVGRSEQSAFGEAQYAGSRHDHVLGGFQRCHPHLHSVEGD